MTVISLKQPFSILRRTSVSGPYQKFIVEAPMRPLPLALRTLNKEVMTGCFGLFALVASAPKPTFGGQHQRGGQRLPE